MNKFKLDKKEILAGFTTFLASSYVIFVNPLVLKDTGMPFEALVTSTVLISFVSTCLMALYARSPILLAPGMGLNTYFTYTLVGHLKVDWRVALGAVFWSGCIFLFLGFIGFRKSLAMNIPAPVRKGVAAGIGLFITLIGLSKGGLIKAHPQTFITISSWNLTNITFILGFFITALFIVRKTPGGTIYSVILTTCIYYLFDLFHFKAGAAAVISEQNVLNLVSWPNFSLIGEMDIWGAFSLSLLPAVFSLLFTNLFDGLSTYLGVCESGGLTGKNVNVDKVLNVDAVATMASGFLGSSPATCYIESVAGIQAGGRTGQTALVAGLLFLPFIFFSPLLKLIPEVAIAPILVLVGPFMLGTLKDVQWDLPEESIPAFISLSFIPFTFSISQGIIWGILSWTFIQIILGHWNRINPTIFCLDLICLFFLFLQ